MKYLHKFNSLTEFSTAYNGQDYYEPWVSLTLKGTPTKVSFVYDNNTYTMEYVESGPVAGNGYYHIWNCEDLETHLAADSRNIEDGNELSYVLPTNDGYEWNNGGIMISDVTVLESDDTSCVHYNKRTGYDLVVDYMQTSNNSGYNKIVQSGNDIHILSENDYIYSIDNNSSLAPTNIYDGKVINLQILNYHGETMNVELTFYTGSFGIVATTTINDENHLYQEYVVVRIHDNGENLNTLTVSISRENPFT